MKRFLGLGTWMVVLSLCCVGIAQAASSDEIKALGDKAAAYIRTNGKEKGLAEINTPKGQFVKGNMYVVAGDVNGVALANPMQPKLQGASMLGVKDANGKLFFQEIVDVAKAKGSGWVSYAKPNRTTKKVEQLKCWVQRVEGHDIWVMSTPIVQ